LRLIRRFQVPPQRPTLPENRLSRKLRRQKRGHARQECRRNPDGDLSVSVAAAWSADRRVADAAPL
jgi:hypothetical protein